MTTCRDVVSLALRLSRVVPSGDAATGDEGLDGLVAMQSLFDQWFTGGMFGELFDVLVTADSVANPQERIVTTSSIAVSYPVIVVEDGIDYPVYELSAIETIVTDISETQRRVFTNGAWVRIDGLTLDSAAPLADKGMDGLAACVAERFVLMFGNEAINAGVVTLAGKFRQNIGWRVGNQSQKSAAEFF